MDEQKPNMTDAAQYRERMWDMTVDMRVKMAETCGRIQDVQARMNRLDQARQHCQDEVFARLGQLEQRAARENGANDALKGVFGPKLGALVSRMPPLVQLLLLLALFFGALKGADWAGIIEGQGRPSETQEAGE